MNRSKDLDTIAPDDPISPQQGTKDFDSKLSNPRSREDSLKKEFLNNKNNSYQEKIYNILGHSKSSFSNFLVNPKVLNFAEKDSDEIIFLAVRPHLLSNVKPIILSLLMAIIPFFFNYLTFLDFLPLKYRISAIFFWYLLTFIFTFEKFLSWYFDFYLITNKRIVDISFNNLLNKHFAQTDISMIQDVSSSVKGFLATIFNFGDLLIQTAAEINQINFEGVPNPSKIIKLIKELQEVDKNLKVKVQL